MTALPLDLPRIGRGFAAVSARMSVDGPRVVTAVAEALSAASGVSIVLRATAAPAPPERVVGAARVLVPLAALGCDAVVEVGVGILACLRAHLAGRNHTVRPALEPLEADPTLLAFCALVAVDAVRSSELGALSPLVALEEPPARVPPGHLSLLLAIEIGAERGWGRVLVPAEVVAALAAPAALSPDAERISIQASLRHGTVTLPPDELCAMAPGDVLLLDDETAVAELVIPGGLTFRGRLAAAVHHIEEIRMTEAQTAYPIVLSVEIARVRLTLGDLARLAPGVALPLDVRRDGAVVLRAGEDVVARGTLVDVEGSLGVRLAQVGAWP